MIVMIVMSHNVIVRTVELIMRFARVHNAMAEDAQAFKWCIRSPRRQERHLQAMGSRRLRHDTHDLRPNLSAQQ